MCERRPDGRTSFGSIQILRAPHLSTLEARRFCNLRLTMLPLHFVVRTLPACESKRELCRVCRFFSKASSTPACDFLSYRLQNVPYMWTTFEPLRSARCRALRAKPETPPSGRVLRARPHVSAVCQRVRRAWAAARSACRASGAPVARGPWTGRMGER